jgi:hypothetical protein
MILWISLTSSSVLRKTLFSNYSIFTIGLTESRSQVVYLHRRGATQLKQPQGKTMEANVCAAVTRCNMKPKQAGPKGFIALAPSVRREASAAPRLR